MDQIRSSLRIWSHLVKKLLMENFIFCAVHIRTYQEAGTYGVIFRWYKWYWVKLKWNIEFEKHPAILCKVVPLPVWKKEIFRDLFSTLSNTYDGVFIAKIVNVF